MHNPDITKAATTIVGLLAPFNSDERRRAVQAAFTLLGESASEVGRQGPGVQDTNGKTLPSRAQAWLRQHGLSRGQVDHAFQVEGDVMELIAAAIPGRTDKERTLNVYVLIGIAQLLATGDSSFDDRAAREACKDLGCFNETNHASYLKDRGNRIAGSKQAGWKLTAPGLAHGAALIKEVTPAA